MITKIPKRQRIIMPSLIAHHVSLADKNWFATGGCARYFAQPDSVESFRCVLAYATTHNLSVFVLGSGANVLISDHGFNGLVIKPTLRNIGITATYGDQVQVMAQAGVTIDELIEWCLDNQISGLEEFSGIPGTVGGSVYINLHYFQFLLSQFLVRAQVIHHASGQVLTVDNSWFNFGYDHSVLQAHKYYLVSATFALKRVTEKEVDYARGRRAEIIRHRLQRYPHRNTCGSFFRNFYDHEVSLEIGGKKMIYVAYYLDKIGIKGVLQVGGARVSHQHANMMVTDNNATSNDIMLLAREMQRLVYDNFGVMPQLECKLVGFSSDELCALGCTQE